MDWWAFHLIFVEGKEVWILCAAWLAFPLVSGVLASMLVDLYCDIADKRLRFDLTKHVLHFIFRYCFLPAMLGAAIVYPLIFIGDQIF